MLETQATVLSPRRSGSRPSRGRGVIWALVAAIAILAVALTIALRSNIALQKRVTQVERIADERGEELRQMSRQCGIAAMVSLDKLSETEEEKEQEEETEETATGQTGIDGSVPAKTERW